MSEDEEKQMSFSRNMRHDISLLAKVEDGIRCATIQNTVTGTSYNLVLYHSSAEYERFLSEVDFWYCERIALTGIVWFGSERVWAEKEEYEEWVVRRVPIKPQRLLVKCLKKGGNR
jgi:hypothetical protein